MSSLRFGEFFLYLLEAKHLALARVCWDCQGNPCPGGCGAHQEGRGMLLGSALVKELGRSLVRPRAEQKDAELGRAEGCRTRPRWPRGDQAKERARALCSLFGKVLASCVMLQKFPRGYGSWGGYWKWGSSSRDSSLPFEGKKHWFGGVGGSVCSEVRGLCPVSRVF